MNATGTISIANDLWEGSITAGGAINVVGGLIAADVTAGTDVVVGQYMSATSVTAGGDITAGSTHVQNITSPTGVLRVASGISPLVFSTDPTIVEQGAAAPHVYSVDSIISPNGIDFSGNQFNGIAGYSSGGLKTINAELSYLRSEHGYRTGEFQRRRRERISNGTAPTLAGDGGSLTVNASGDITAKKPHRSDHRIGPAKCFALGERRHGQNQFHLRHHLQSTSAFRFHPMMRLASPATFAAAAPAQRPRRQH